MNKREKGMHLAVSNAEGLLLDEHGLEAIRKSYQRQEILKFHMLCDEFAYLLIFCTGSGTWGILESEKLQGPTTLIRKAMASLILQRRNHFIHQSSTLPDDFIGGASDHLINMNTESLGRHKDDAWQGRMKFATGIQREFQKNMALEHFFLPLSSMVMNIGLMLVQNGLPFQHTWAFRHSLLYSR
jgi:hypothetical protein